MTQRKELNRAVAHVRSLVVTITRRRPMNFPAYAADGALEHLRIARLHLEKAEALYEKYQGPMPEAIEEAAS